VHFSNEVHFTRHLFGPENGILRHMLAPTGTQSPKLQVTLGPFMRSGRER